MKNRSEGPHPLRIIRQKSQENWHENLSQVSLEEKDQLMLTFGSPFNLDLTT